MTDQVANRDAAEQAREVRARSVRRLERLQARQTALNRSIGDPVAGTATAAEVDELVALEREIAKHEALADWAEAEYVLALEPDGQP
jgi:hypothetical protein